MEKISIACMGDIMPGGILHNSCIDISTDLQKYLDSFDFRFGTLECAIGNEPTFDPVKMSLLQDVIYAPNMDLDKLQQLHLDVVSLANNHLFDLGINGMINTIEQLDRIGIKHCGAGRNLEEASRPVILDYSNTKIGIIAFCDYREETVGYVPQASVSTAGVNSLSGDGYKDQISQLSQKADYTIVLIHWGVEHTFWPTSHMLEVGRQCVKSGASAIIGTHQHRVQPLIKMSSAPIFLGLGNFLFPPRYLRPPRPMFYPEPNQDTSKYPITDCYPWVNEPTYKIWKPLGRVGAIGKITICNNKIIGEMTYVELVDGNRLNSHNKSLPMKRRELIEFHIVELALSLVSISNIPYNIINLFRRAFRKVYRITKKYIYVSR